MKKTRNEREARRLRRVAAAFEARGYTVCLEPSASDLPQWLGGFRPDLIATGNDESVVVEVKSREELHQSPALRELAEAVESQPGWRLQLDVSNPRETQSAQPSFSPAGQQRIEEWLRAALQLLDSGMVEPALIMSWAAFEGAARRVLEDSGSEPPISTSALLKTLWAHGYLEPRTRDTLRTLADTRNRVVHGGEAARRVRASDSETLHRITQELLAAAAE